jgi:competence protein ComEC
VGATHAVASAGHRNRFGHPHPEVITRLAATGTRLLHTGVGGAVRFRVGAPGGVEIAAIERRDARHPWSEP